MIYKTYTYKGFEIKEISKFEFEVSNHGQFVAHRSSIPGAQYYIDGLIKMDESYHAEIVS